jgi:hypothetical protein
MPNRFFPVSWYVEKIVDGFVVRDAKGQAIVYLYSRGTEAEARQAKVLTDDEAQRIALNIAKLPALLQREDDFAIIKRLSGNQDTAPRQPVRPRQR